MGQDSSDRRKVEEKMNKVIEEILDDFGMER